jgi:hypothetical protein
VSFSLVYFFENIWVEPLAPAHPSEIGICKEIRAYLEYLIEKKDYTNFLRFYENNIEMSRYFTILKKPALALLISENELFDAMTFCMEKYRFFYYLTKYHLEHFQDLERRLSQEILLELPNFDVLSHLYGEVLLRNDKGEEAQIHFRNSLSRFDKKYYIFHEDFLKEYKNAKTLQALSFRMNARYVMLRNFFMGKEYSDNTRNYYSSAYDFVGFDTERRLLLGNYEGELEIDNIYKNSIESVYNSPLFLYLIGEYIQLQKITSKHLLPERHGWSNEEYANDWFIPNCEEALPYFQRAFDTGSEMMRWFFGVRPTRTQGTIFSSRWLRQIHSIPNHWIYPYE